MDFIIVIPARYKSSRLPGKPLIDIAGKSMLQRTYEQCIKAVSPELVYVATEDVRIVNHCKELNINVILTSDTCNTGTDRVAEVAEKIHADYYINVQGDEPVFNPDDLSKIIDYIRHTPASVVNGYCAIDSEEDFNSRSIPKVVFRPDGRLLYMSRSGIPGNKSGMFVQSWRQVCVYAFAKPALEKFYHRNNKTCLEEIEDIEILRFLELGMDVNMLEMSSESIAVDTPADVTKVEKRLGYVREI